MTLVRPEEWRPQGIDDIEPNAWNTLRETSGSVCVTAGAGAGKTEFLAQKAAYLLQTGICAAPKRILAISFKRDAARNLSLRVQERCPPEQSRRFVSMTFDAFTKHMLDQFGRAVPDPYTPPPNYKIIMPTRGDFDQFLRRKSGSLNAQQMERLVARAPLPVAASNLNTNEKELLSEYWKYQYDQAGEVQLSFAMINRLIDYMIRANSRVRRALHVTYPHVFLDEFQDTTVAQYELLRTIFASSGTNFTAVGDDKQRIMGWAGAMRNAFQTFRTDFNAKPESLLLNWRSHEALVAVQRVIAAKIDPNVLPVEARGTQTVDGDIAAIWQFANREEECRTLASWVRSQVEEGIVQPHELVILVRMHADRVETELTADFDSNGLVIRNLARTVGDIAIQDLLSEELTAILLPLIRVAAGKRDGAAWAKARDGQRLIHALAEDDDAGLQKIQQQLQNFTRELRTYMSGRIPDGGAAREIVRRTIDYVGIDILRQAFPEYGRDSDFERVRRGFELLLVESADAESSWVSALDRFEGLGQVPLMTIHKSKGLEFHTIVFLGLDDRSWWSLNPTEPDELNSFFVAFTRAKQRAFFTSCSERGVGIKWIDDLLAPAGVRRIVGRRILK